MNALELLKEKLEQFAGMQSFSSSAWGQPQSMTRALAEIKKAFDAPTSILPERSIAQTLAEYRRTGLLRSFLELKYTCYGIGHRFADGWCLFNDNRLFSNLLDRVDNLRPEPSRFRKAYQGLLSSYFSYPIFACESKTNWEHLRVFLTDRLQAAKLAKPTSGWLILLEEHQNLLGIKPCERYVGDVREGNFKAVNQMLHEGLGVPRVSWVWQELVMSQVEVACGHNDQEYKDDLERLLKMLGAGGILSINLVIRCVAMLVSRYTQCSSKPEHSALRDAAVSHIGNPWLKRTAWDAHVKTGDGQPHEEARQMINGWIKRRLIKDFFEILSDDGSADQRRLSYWLRFEPAVEDMWFALGPHASRHTGSDFKDFRNRARGRLLKLESPGVPQNNAFIMRLGAITVVEFGSRGNATYIYRSEDLPFELGRSWINGDSTGLKNQQKGERFTHRDIDSTGTRWEGKLDAILSPLIGFRPTQEGSVRRRVTTKPQHVATKPQPESTIKKPVFAWENKSQIIPAQSQSVTTTIKPPISSANRTSGCDPNWETKVKDVCRRLMFSIKDNRPKGGGYWVMYYNANCPELKKLGFRFKPGKGWWKE